MRLSTFIAVAVVFATLGLAQTEPAPGAAASVTIRQGESISTLNPTAQSVIFVKSEAEDPKAAIANTLITQVGLNLLTMGVGSQMLRWNPYMGEAFQQFTNVGKSVFTGHGTDVKGFEYDSLPGLAARVTLKPLPAELIIPLEPFRPAADFSFDNIQPVLLRLQVRLDDQMRLLASHRVVIKQEKKGRFDLKPKSERQEAAVDERAIPIQFERQPGNVLRVTTSAPLEPGEYALVLRTKSGEGAPTQNVALKPIAGATPVTAAAPSPEPPAPPRSPFGVFKKSAPPQNVQTPPTGTTVGFLAWDFRVVY
jgi:hypothetical protein